MIPLKRLDPPNILVKKAAEWRDEFLDKKKNDATAKSAAKRYGHKHVRERLRATSHNKCFYCEAMVQGASEQVDHHVEHSEQPRHAYDWEYLYLSCIDCNVGKPSNAEIPVKACLDPCGRFAAERIEDHLTFRDEVACERDGSPWGLKTIQKYRLNRPTLRYERLKQLQRFCSEVMDLLRVLNVQKRPMRAADIARLRVYASPTMPFSRMIDVYLQGFIRKLNAGARPPSRSSRGGRGGAPAAR
jgi:uncharacterized protein (TIGR02646 family)